MSETLNELLNVSDTAYLEHLTSLDIDTLLSEPTVLQTQSHHLTSSLTSLTHTSYPTFVSLYSSTSGLGSSLSELSSSLDGLVTGSLPALESSVSKWNTETTAVLATRRKTLTVLESQDKLRDLLDIPLLIHTCVRNSYFSEALALAAHARGLITAYVSPPLILTSVLAEVDVAINYMLVSLLTILHEPNRKLPALWKAVNFLRKMQGAFGGEEEIALAFLSGRELCIKGSLESLRRDIFRIITVDGELSARDKDDLARYLGKYVGLWREGVYDLITQYESIFLATATEENASSIQLHALLTTYVSHAFRTHLTPLLTSSQHISIPPIISLSMSSFPSLVTQLGYCAAALARVGAEFRSMVARYVSDAVIYIFSRDILQVEKRFLAQFERRAQRKKSKDIQISRSPSNWLLSVEALESQRLPNLPHLSSTTPPHTPPSLLTSYPPLATHANEIIEVFNSLRACVPIGAARGYHCVSGQDEADNDDIVFSTEGLGILESLEHSLAREGRVIFDYVIGVLELEESLEVESSLHASESTEPLRESAVAMAFARAFFETWVPWVIKAMTNGIFGLSDTSSEARLTLQMKEPNSKLGQLLDDWQRWIENSTKDAVSPFPQ